MRRHSITFGLGVATRSWITADVVYPEARGCLEKILVPGSDA